MFAKRQCVPRPFYEASQLSCHLHYSYVWTYIATSESVLHDNISIRIMFDRNAYAIIRNALPR